MVAKLKQKGMSLISVLVAAGIFLLIAVQMQKQISSSMRGQALLRDLSDLEAMKRLLITTIDCNASMQADPCIYQGQIVALRRGNSNDDFISASGSGTRFGHWTLRAECNDADGDVIVRAARLKPGSLLTSESAEHFLPDPLTGRVYTWQDTRSLIFPAGLPLCPAGSGNGSSGSGSSSVSFYCAGTSAALVNAYANYGCTETWITSLGGSHVRETSAGVNYISCIPGSNIGGASGVVTQPLSTPPGPWRLTFSWVISGGRAKAICFK